MNENTLKRIHNHYVNNPKDQRATFSQVIETELSNKKTKQNVTNFSYVFFLLLKSIRSKKKKNK